MITSQQTWKLLRTCLTNLILKQRKKYKEKLKTCLLISIMLWDKLKPMYYGVYQLNVFV